MREPGNPARAIRQASGTSASNAVHRPHHARRPPWRRLRRVRAYRAQAARATARRRPIANTGQAKRLRPTSRLAGVHRTLRHRTPRRSRCKSRKKNDPSPPSLHSVIALISCHDGSAGNRAQGSQPPGNLANCQPLNAGIPGAAAIQTRNAPAGKYFPGQGVAKALRKSVIFHVTFLGFAPYNYGHVGRWGAGRQTFLD
jgi:hypothetical protein